MNTIKKGIIGVDLGATITSAGIVHGDKNNKIFRIKGRLPERLKKMFLNSYL